MVIKTDFDLKFKNLDWENVLPSPEFNLTDVKSWAKQASGFVLMTINEQGELAYSMLNVSQDAVIDLLIHFLEEKPYVRSALFGQLMRRIMIILEGNA